VDARKRFVYHRKPEWMIICAITLSEI